MSQCGAFISVKTTLTSGAHPYLVTLLCVTANHWEALHRKSHWVFHDVFTLRAIRPQLVWLIPALESNRPAYQLSYYRNADRRTPRPILQCNLALLPLCCWQSHVKVIKKRRNRYKIPRLSLSTGHGSCLYSYLWIQITWNFVSWMRTYTTVQNIQRSSMSWLFSSFWNSWTDPWHSNHIIWQQSHLHCKKK